MRTDRARTRLILHHRWALGDTILLSALVRDLHRAYPGRYEIMVDTAFRPVWLNNPLVVPLNSNSQPPPQLIKVSWGKAITDHSLAVVNGRRVPRHILAWYHHDFTTKTGVPVPVTEPRPDLHLSATERRPLLNGRYWVIFSGGKLDLTNKHWWIGNYQRVVDMLAAQGIACVQCGATHAANVHPPLDRCLNMVGKTDNVRDLFSLILHADGVIGPVTGAMHAAAALQRPCVVIAGAREEPWFEAYVNGTGAFGPDCASVTVPHKFLHTAGALPCCARQCCWKKRTVPLDHKDLTPKGKKMLCLDPIRGEGQAVAHCMDLIDVDMVVEAVLSYYEEGYLPPLW